MNRSCSCFASVINGLGLPGSGLTSHIHQCFGCNALRLSLASLCVAPWLSGPGRQESGHANPGIAANQPHTITALGSWGIMLRAKHLRALSKGCPSVLWTSKSCAMLWPEISFFRVLSRELGVRYLTFWECIGYLIPRCPTKNWLAEVPILPSPSLSEVSSACKPCSLLILCQSCWS